MTNGLRIMETEGNIVMNENVERQMEKLRDILNADKRDIYGTGGR